MKTACLAIASLLGFALTVRGEVVRVVVAKRTDIGMSGYERVVGTIRFAIDPRDPRNAVIVDLDKAPVNAGGRVEFSADLHILRPKDAARANGVALVEVSNRGNKNLLSLFSRAASGGRDPSTDIAVLQVAAKSRALTPLTFANSDRIQVGDPVVAIGNPFRLDRSVTAGIVSALQRPITAPNGFTIDHVIQTDAALNHGNSGGPLLDLRGSVVGVNAQIRSDSGGNEGVGFAIPANTVRTGVSQLISAGKVEHAYLGVSIQTVPGDAAAALGVPRGVAVTQVVAGAPAASAASPRSSW